MIRNKITQLLKSITALDALEEQHLQSTMHWVLSEEEIFRIEKPDTPNKHLVSYFAPIDLKEGKILLVHHRKANLWIPAGGHVEINEHPTDTVSRELKEELFIEADFLMPEPLFLTVTPTSASGRVHIDVSLWYILRGDASLQLSFDEREFYSIKWFKYDEIPYSSSEPHMKRFITKLKNQDSLCSLNFL